MKKVSTLFLIILLFTVQKAKAELVFYDTPKSSIIATGMKVVKNGILLGEDSGSTAYNGLYLDNVGNLDFKAQILGGYKITDIAEDSSNYYAGSFNILYNQIGLFKISKDFKTFTNIGMKATTRKILPFRDKVYTGGTVHGCYVVNKDGTGLTQILGDGYYGPYIDDLKADSKNVYILSRGLIYKVDYDTNQKSQLLTTVRPAYFDIDENRIYAATYNQFFYINPISGSVSNTKTFYNQISYMKKYKNFILIAESSPTITNFWISKDYGITFYKSKTTISADHQIRNIEIIGDKELTIYFAFNYYGVSKAKLVFDFEEVKLFGTPFSISNSTELYDKITSYFDHRYPVLGNAVEDPKYSSTTLNFLGKELPTPYLYYSSHDGIDFGLPLNTPVIAVEGGSAEYYYQDKGLGNAILISHPNGYLSIYGHLSDEDLITKSKVSVSKGQKIGKVGMSGNTNGPHLHFTSYIGARSLSNKVDPFGWFGNFQDPWSAPSKYLWEIKPESLNSQINLKSTNIVNYQNVTITNSPTNLSTPINVLISKTPPVLDTNNYEYKLSTSYYFGFTDFLNTQTDSLNLINLKFSGFSSYKDEKNYSIWKVSDSKFEKLESRYDPYSSSLNATSNLNSDFLVLKNKYQKITASSNFKTK